MPRPTDMLQEVIEAAVERALERRLPDLLKSHMPDAAPKPVPKAAPQIDGERFVVLREAAVRLGVHRTTLLRWEAQGMIPKRRRMPGGKTGWLASEVEAFLAGLAKAQTPVPAKVN